MITVSIINNKGGVGKTTTAINLSAGLKMLYGKRVLLIDLDPQGNAATGLGLDPYNTKTFPYSIADVLANSKMKLSDAIVKGKYCDMIVNNMYSYNKLNQTNGDVTLLQKKINSERLPYDFVIIDTPPSIEYFTSNAILASNTLLIVTEFSKYSMQGVQVLLSILDSWKNGPNRAVSNYFAQVSKPVLLTMVQSGTRLTKAMTESLEETSPTGFLLNTRIPRSIKVAENAYEGMPSVLKANNPAGIAYKELCETFYFAGKSGILYGKNYSVSIK